MEIFAIFLIAICFCLVGVLLVNGIEEESTGLIIGSILLFGVIFVLLLIISFLGFGGIGYKDGQKDALKGKNMLELKVNYKQINDSTYVPSDTIFIEIKK